MFSNLSQRCQIVIGLPYCWTSRNRPTRYSPDLVGAYLGGLSADWQDGRQVRRKPAQRPNFPRVYTPDDIAPLAAMNTAHGDLSGPAIRHLSVRAHQVHHQAGYERLSGISVSHIYNLRKRREYRQRRMNFTKTRPTPVSIGERRKPEPGRQLRRSGVLRAGRRIPSGLPLPGRPGGKALNLPSVGSENNVSPLTNAFSRW